MKISDVIQRSDTRAGQIFDWIVIGLIVTSIIALSLETLPDLPDSFRKILQISEIIIVICFTIEYLLRVATTERKFRYIFSFYGLTDLAAIIPIYLTLGGIDTRALRAVRLFRVIRILKLSRYNEAITRFGMALKLAMEEIVLFMAAVTILLYLSALGIYYFEHEAQPEEFASVFHSLWWATTTLTTVGYGDVYPITLGGKLFTFVILMCGLGIVAVPAGIVATALNKAREKKAEKVMEDHGET